MWQCHISFYPKNFFLSAANSASSMIPASWSSLAFLSSSIAERAAVPPPFEAALDSLISLCNSLLNLIAVSFLTLSTEIDPDVVLIVKRDDKNEVLTADELTSSM